MKKLVVLCLVMMIGVSFSFMACSKSASRGAPAPKEKRKENPGPRSPHGTSDETKTETEEEKRERELHEFDKAKKLENIEIPDGTVFEIYWVVLNPDDPTKCGLMGYLGDSNELYASIDMNIPLVKNVTSSPTFVKISGEHVVLKRPNNNTVPLALYVCVQEDNWVTRISLTNSVRNSILVDWWKNKKVKIDFDAGWLVGGTIKLSIVD